MLRRKLTKWTLAAGVAVVALALNCAHHAMRTSGTMAAAVGDRLAVVGVRPAAPPAVAGVPRGDPRADIITVPRVVAGEVPADRPVDGAVTLGVPAAVAGVPAVATPIGVRAVVQRRILLGFQWRLFGRHRDL